MQSIINRLAPALRSFPLLLLLEHLCAILINFGPESVSFAFFGLFLSFQAFHFILDLFNKLALVRVKLLKSPPLASLPPGICLRPEGTVLECFVFLEIAHQLLLLVLFLKVRLDS